MSNKKIVAVPTNIITGFLGVGKTTAILHLLKNKPAKERWAVLVNEFGEIGVDGSLIKGGSGDNKVYIREVPGGCMCCAAGLPMQIALNQLLAQAKPDRLLIEPTGLGHPVEVIQVLSAEHYQKNLRLQNIITLVDARKLSDERYAENNTFNQQLKVADIIVGNKQDLYQSGDKAKLNRYGEKNGFEKESIKFVQLGELNLDWLNCLSSKAISIASPGDTVHHLEHPDDLSEQELSDSGFLCAKNQGEGFYSEGWRISPEILFSQERLYCWMSGLNVERLKAVFITTGGIYGYNLSDGLLTQIEIDDCLESRIEIIYSDEQLSFESALKQCVDS